MTTSSDGSIPSGLTLYIFEYDEWSDNPKWQYLEDDKNALFFKNLWKADRVINIMTGEEIK